MLRNGSNILKNGGNIFKSQVVDSYLNLNANNGFTITTRTAEALTPTASLSVYFETPTAIVKKTCCAGTTQSFTFDATGEDSRKNIYFCGDLDNVCAINPNNTYLCGCYSGDLVCFANEFPNLEELCMAQRIKDFNQDISYSTFPSSLRNFYLFDGGIQGDFDTISGLENLERVCLYCTRGFTGSFHNIGTTALTYTCIYSTTPSFDVDIEEITTRNPNYTCSLLSSVCGISGCADNMDLSNLTHINWYLPYDNLVGSATNWSFNTGLTYACITTKCVTDTDITNWNITDAPNLCYMCLSNQGYSTSHFSGSTSGWTVPSALQQFGMSYYRNVTDIPTDFSGSDLRGLNMTNINSLCFDITDLVFPTPNNVTSLIFYCTGVYGDLSTFNIPSGITSLQLRLNGFTGDLGSIDIPDATTYVYFDCNDLTGNVSDLDVSASRNQVYLSGNNCLCWDLNTPFDTCNLQVLAINSISAITGSFSNFSAGTNFTTLQMCYICNGINSDLTELGLNNMTTLYAHNSNICGQDITPMFTGSTSVTNLSLCANANLSGDTTNWQVNDMRNFFINSTALSGRLCHSCPYYFRISNTDICSCIDTDIDFSQIGYSMCMNSTCVQGHLSAVTFNMSSIYNFTINSNPDIYGSNEFTDYIFVNRKNFSRTTLYFYYAGIGDTVSGTSEVLGDLGTYGGDPSGFDLTEAQVNNLVDGIDYDGGGSNTPWDGKNKIYWIKNALVSSSSSTKRYPTFNMTYS